MKFHETYQHGGCKRYAYRKLELINAVNNYIKFRLLKTMNVREANFMNNLTIKPSLEYLQSGSQASQT